MIQYNSGYCKRTWLLYRIWGPAMYEKYAPYIQSQLLDIITCCRFSLHDAAPLKDDETFSVTCLATEAHFVPFLADESRVFTEGKENVRTAWTNSVKSGDVVLAKPEHYIILK